jgi:hypothetical protein
MVGDGEGFVLWRLGFGTGVKEERHCDLSVWCLLENDEDCFRIV